MPTQKNILTRLAGKPLIKKVVELYEGSRPQGLACSYVSHAPEHATSSNTHFDQTRAMAQGAIVNQLGGVKAAAVAIGVQAVSDAWGALKDWWGDQGASDMLISLDYLQSPSSIQFPQNANTSQAEKARLMKLYELVYTYQVQKMSRGWLNTGWGSNYALGVIDDAKYLTAILIGRKILFALNAADQVEYNQQLSHLSGFLESLPVDAAAVFDTSSDNKRQISLIELVRNLRVSDFDKALADHNESVVEQVKSKLQALHPACQEMLDHMNDAMLYSMTTFTPADRGRLNIAAQASHVKSRRHYPLIQSIFLNGEIGASELPANLATLLSDASGVAISANDSVVQASVSFLQKKDEFIKLHAVLLKIKRLVELKGLLGMVSVVKEIAITMDRMQQHYRDLMIAHDQFAKELMLLNSHRHQFNLNRIQYNTRQYFNQDLHADMIDTFALAKSVTPAVTEDLGNEAQALISDIQQHVTGESTEVDVEERIVSMQEQAQVIEHEHVERLSKQVEALSTEYGNLLNELADAKQRSEADIAARQYEIDSLQTRLAALAEQAEQWNTERRLWMDKVNKLNSQLGNLPSEIERLKTENSQLKEQVADLNRQNNELRVSEIVRAAQVSNPELAQNASDNPPPTRRRHKGSPSVQQEQQAISKLPSVHCREVFSKFLNEYICQSRPRSMVIWHRHGMTGIKMAQDVLTTWNEESQGKNVSELQALLRNMIAGDAITGNFHKHSLKTYLLRFYDYLATVRDVGYTRHFPTPEAVFKAEFTDKLVDHQAYQAETRWRDISEGVEVEAVRVSNISGR